MAYNKRRTQCSRGGQRSELTSEWNLCGAAICCRGPGLCIQIGLGRNKATRQPIYATISENKSILQKSALLLIKMGNETAEGQMQ